MTLDTSGIIKMICEKLNRVQTGTSKIDNERYRFEYTTDDLTLINKRNQEFFSTEKEAEETYRKRRMEYRKNKKIKSA